jgi:glycine/D-amino acid oxidase-like deaminating enzyme
MFMRSDVDVAIIGGGVFGASVAAHLAMRGCHNVLVLEAHEIGSQTSSQAAGLVPLLRSSVHLTEMARYSLTVFDTFARDIGTDIQFRQVGSLKLALTAERAAELRVQVQTAMRLNVPMAFIGGRDVRRRMPALDLEGVQAVTYAPRDGYVGNPAAIARGYAAQASRMGVKVVTGTRVLQCAVVDGCIQGLETSQGYVSAKRVVLAAGAWTPAMAALTGVQVPTVPVLHQLQVTGPLPGIHPAQPVVRIPDCSAYIRPAGQGLIVGAFEAQPRSYAPGEITPAFRMSELEPNRESLRCCTETITPYLPILEGAKILRTQQGLPTFTPDGSPLIGEVPGLAGLFVACGCCATGISLSPAIGRIVAELLTEGEAFVETAPLSLTRFGATRLELAQLRQACEAVYARYYALGEGKI